MNIKNYFASLLFYFFLGFCNVYNITKEKWNELYNYNPTVKRCIDIIQYNIEKTYSFFTLKRMEPIEDIWSCNCWLFYSIHENELIKYGEQYFFTKETLDNNSPDSLVILPLIIIKNKHEGGIRYIVKMVDTNEPQSNFVNSKARFLSIEYSHPSMKYIIVLTLSREWFISGNELFTPTFILRLLEYQEIDFIFDENYSIKIMDLNCNIFDINSQSYILLTAENYEIKHFDFFNDYKTVHLIEGDVQ